MALDLKLPMRVNYLHVLLRELVIINKELRRREEMENREDKVTDPGKIQLQLKAIVHKVIRNGIAPYDLAAQ